MKRDWYLHDERADYEVIALSGCAQPSLLLRSSLMTLFRTQYLVDNDPVSMACQFFLDTFLDTVVAWCCL